MGQSLLGRNLFAKLPCLSLKNHQKGGAADPPSQRPQSIRRKPIISEDCSIPAAAKEHEDAETPEQHGDVRFGDSGEVQHKTVAIGAQ